MSKRQSRQSTGLIRRLLIRVATGVVGVVVMVSSIRIANDFFSHYPIASIDVMGDIRYVEESTLRHVLAQYTEKSFFTVDLDQVKRDLEMLTWIQTAQAYRRWPGKLVVTLEEQVPIANWGENRFLSEKHEVFFADGVQPDPNLPTFIGRSEKVGLIAERYQAIADTLAPVGLEIQTLEVDARLSWTVTCRNGLVLVVDEDNSVQKMKRVALLYPIFTAEQKQRLARIDLRYENGLAIKWKKTDGDTDAA